jgi:Ca-activated chloride channel family protein
MWEDVFFENPEWFWLLLALPLLGIWQFVKRNKENAVVHISSTKGFDDSKSILPKLRPILYVIRLLSLGLFIIAMARPRTVDVTSQIKGTEGVDIVIAADISTSMLAQDFKPNRLEALKKVAGEFVDRRKTDRIGIVIYAGESYTKTPLTTDKALVKRAISEINFTDAIDGGTAIGMGIATSVNRLKDSKAESKVIILLTDGVNNSGFIDPEIATELAMEYGIKIYSIGIGTQGKALSPVAMLPNGKFRYRPVEVEIDEELLTRISNLTDGKYYRATNLKKLEEIYEEIDALEKTEIEEEKFYDYEEKYKPLVVLGLALLLFEFILRNTLFRTFV